MEFGDRGDGGPPREASDGVQKQAKRKMKTPSQIDALEKAYTVSSTLSEEMRLELSQKTQLSTREISMWFANKRFQGKQAHLLTEPKREGEHSPSLHSRHKGGESRFVLAACHFMDSATNQVSNRETSSKRSRPLQASPQLKMKTQMQPMIPQHHSSSYPMDPLVLTFIERKLGGPLREDGPLVGMNFDPLPPGAFGSPLCSGNERMRKLEQPARIPKEKSILKQNVGSNKTISVLQQTNSSYLQNPLWKMPIDEVGFASHSDSAHTLSNKLPCFPSGNRHPQTKKKHAKYALQADTQFTIYPANVIVDKFVLTDTLANDATFEAERRRESEEAHTRNKVEDLNSLVASKISFFRREKEVQSCTGKEMHGHERKNGEEDDEKLHYVDQHDYCKKLLNDRALKEEKVRQPDEVQLEDAAMDEALSGTSMVHGNVQGNMRLMEDDKLELMRLAASWKGLPSIDVLDNDTLDNLHIFQDMLGTFPPESVAMKRPFAIPPWTDSEENVGNLLMVWKFLVSFGGEFGLWPFTLDEFAQAFHDHDSRLLGEIHVALLKHIIRDLEDAKNIRAPSNYEDNAENPGSTCLKIVDGADAWGFDVHFWKNKLNFLTWPEILRQLALAAGFGPKLNEFGRAYHHGDKDMNAGYKVSASDKNGGNNSLFVQGKEKTSSFDISYMPTPGTLGYAVFHSLFLVGSEGLTPVEVADYIQEHGLFDLGTMESAHSSITDILLKDVKLFERAGSVTYRVKPCILRDPLVVERMLTGATSRICMNARFGMKEFDRNFHDPCLGDKDENFGDSFGEHHLGGKFCRESLFNLSARASISSSESNRNMRTDETGFENVDRVSSSFPEIVGEGTCLRTPNDSSKHFSELWIQELTKGEYSFLSIEQRLDVLVALVGVLVEGNSFHIFIEERLKKAQAYKKAMLAKMRLDKRLQEEKYQFVDDTNHALANPASYSKQAQYLRNHGTINNVSNSKKNLGRQFSPVSNCFPPEKVEHVGVLCLSQLELSIDEKAEMLHSYRFLPLGEDRRRNRYWQFSTSSSRNDPGSGRVFFESNEGFWRVIDSDEAFDAILATLDSRGCRESHLHLMLKHIEKTFKDTTKRRKNGEFYAESTSDTMQMITALDRNTANHNSGTVLVLPAYDELQTSASIKIDISGNEKGRISALKKRLQFLKWMWKECFNPDLLCAMRFGTKRCAQLLETCDICYQSYLTSQIHCTGCHVTFNVCNDEHFNNHIIRCEADFRIRISVSFFPINIGLMKALLAVIEASIPMEGFYPLWDDGNRKSWGVRLNLSSTAAEIFQSLTLLENAIKPNYLCPDFVTTRELLIPAIDLLGNSTTLPEEVPLIPWIPETTAAIALRLFDLDASIHYIMKHGIEPIEDPEARDFILLPRSTVFVRSHWVESAASDDIDDQNRAHECHAEGDFSNQKQGTDGEDNFVQRSYTSEQHKSLEEDNSDMDDLRTSGNSDKFDIDSESSGAKTYDTNAGSVRMYSKAEVMDDDNEFARGNEFYGGEAVESNENLRWQETVDMCLDIDDYSDDEQESEAGHSNIVLEQTVSRRDRNKKIVREKGSSESDRWDVENSSSVNTK